MCVKLFYLSLIGKDFKYLESLFLFEFVTPVAFKVLKPWDILGGDKDYLMPIHLPWAGSPSTQPGCSKPHPTGLWIS